MVAIFRSIVLPVDADAAWALVGAFGRPEALAPGFVAACEMVGAERVVTFADGSMVREALVARDETRRRLSYAAVGGRARHHQAAMEVVPIDAGNSRIDWTTDVLPNDLGSYIAARMDAGVVAIGRSLAG